MIIVMTSPLAPPGKSVASFIIYSFGCSVTPNWQIVASIAQPTPVKICHQSKNILQQCTHEVGGRYLLQRSMFSSAAVGGLGWAWPRASAQRSSSSPVFISCMFPLIIN
jgi:hypothetical protein